jgi:hypothetical protein
MHEQRFGYITNNIAREIYVFEILLRLNECSFQILGVENLKYLDMTGWYCNKVSGHIFDVSYSLVIIRIHERPEIPKITYGKEDFNFRIVNDIA